MWLGELSTCSGVPIPTIKYYLREALLPRGDGSGPARASYDERHLDRLRLIRALVGVGGMPIARVREVLAAVDDESVSVAAAMGSAHLQLSEDTAPSAASQARVDSAVTSRRWRVETDGRHGRAVAAALDAMEAAGSPMTDATLAVYVEAADTIGRADLAGMTDLSRARAVERAVAGTVLGEPVLLALRRLSHENQARRRTRR